MRFTAWRQVAACALLSATITALAAGSVAAPRAPAPAKAVASASAPASAALASATRLEDYQLLAMSASEHVAVLRGPDRRLVTLRVGMSLPVEHAVLKEVAGGKLRFDVLGAEHDHQTAWMSRGATPEAPAVVERIASKGPAAPTTPHRLSKQVPLSSSTASSAK
jgi:hypothetical protein